MPRMSGEICPICWSEGNRRKSNIVHFLGAIGFLPASFYVNNVGYLWALNVQGRVVQKWTHLGDLKALRLATNQIALALFVIV